MSVQEDLGRIQINNDVIATIASLAAVEVDGIVSVAGGSSLAEVWGSKGMKKGITVTTDEATGNATIDLEVNVEYGVDVYKAAHQLQRSVKNAVESMTGLHVDAVNVSISSIVLGERPRRPAALPAREAPSAED
ncbi:MAG TPA: Asp23/Gls24 family envelope stress response protein [Candidatus Sumerlaeota bacterium]|nr:MAG: Alkaline shock protein 23 [candidate division BRC1 bacterium ADurb.BinA292]HOE97588.1 Asp23/Gls24 family envelope stress response protein [Candidatus Sumerlaeota bacterium]HOR29156.1 Asp23/Gls24 family envelope stress response protein [Candidatus Sumerlaeota bacterium]HPK04061.1 Asp23/Gls24 family envelope stress response protein [Candidatus Sumerlaeota bacterium]